MNDAALDQHQYVLGSPSAHVGLLNCERIAERRHIHNWTVAPHYHEGLSQLFLFGRGNVTGQIDDSHYRLQSPALVWAPALCRHGFDYEPEMLGWVITIPSADVVRLTEGRPWLRDLTQKPHVLQGQQHAALLAEVQLLVGRIEEEHQRYGVDRNLALESLFQLLLLNLYRGLPEEPGTTPSGTGRGRRVVQRFEELLDQHLHTTRSVASFAAMMAVTPTHLSRTVKEVTGSTAGAIIQDRVLLEAKRRLVFSDHPVAEIAYALDFSSPSYFSRFFTARTGETPASFRRRARYTAEDV
ncbi:helix-turn-helix domain-containing protein [Nisaea sp.]|uniref:helix-turn-helix domain-containing protein n=1 Tax=Nisaea sp. TaxID=2024842 RepID=UPI003266BBA9